MTFAGEVRAVEDVAAAFADLVAELMPRSPSLALSGGSTAEACYAALATRSLDWSGTEVFYGDERFVPVTDADSNEGMTRRVLLDHVWPLAVHSMVGDAATAEEAASRYDDLLAARDPIDLVHLGLGPDGHIASIFPGSPTMAVTDRLVVTAGDAQHPHPRLTFTYPAIARSPFVVVTVAGEEKRDAFARVRAGDDSLPATRVRAADRVIWLVDAAALGQA
jgi:6-phosphogluconolactonase